MSGISTGLLQALISGGGLEDPYAAAGKGVAQVQFAPAEQYDNPWQLALAKATTGLASGLLSGYGKAREEQAAAEKSQLLVKALQSGDPMTELAKHPELSQLTTALAPELAISEQNRKREMAAKLQQQRFDLAKEGMTVGPEGLPIIDPTLTQGLADKTKAIEKAKKLGEQEAQSQIQSTMGPGGFLKPEEKLAQEKQIQAYSQPYVQKFNESEIGFRSMLKSYFQKGKAADIDFLYGGIQAAEPGLAVKGDEQSMIKAVGGLGGVFQDAWSQINSTEGGIAPETRKKILEYAANRRDARLQILHANLSGASEQASRLGLDIRNIFPTPLPDESDVLLSKLDSGGNANVALLAKSVQKSESGGEADPSRAVSSKGAIGPMQLMPETAKELGVNPWNTEENIKGGTAYLNQLLEKYQGNEKLALAAYNWGMGNVDELIAKKRTLNWSELSRGEAVPEETKKYVKKTFEDYRQGLTATDQNMTPAESKKNGASLQPGEVVFNGWVYGPPGADGKPVKLREYK